MTVFFLPLLYPLGKYICFFNIHIFFFSYPFCYKHTYHVFCISFSCCCITVATLYPVNSPHSEELDTCIYEEHLYLNEKKSQGREWW